MRSRAGRSRRVLAAAVTMVLLAAVAVPVTRYLFLPASACSVSQRAVDEVRLELGYDAVRVLLGCDGVLVESRDWGEIRQDVYQWRGDAWPFGRFEGVFYNRVLHQTGKLWFNVQITFPAAAGAE